MSRETVRLNHVPSGDAATALMQRKLPLFSHATEEEYRELFVSLRDNARASSSYQVLMVLSVPLSLSFSHPVERVRILDGLPRGAIQFQDFSVEVENADVTLGDPLLIVMVLSSREPLNATQVDEIRAYIGRTLDRPFQLEVQSNIRR